MEDHLGKSLDKLEQRMLDLADKMEQLNLTLVRNTNSLERHEYRTTLAEDNIRLLREEIRPIKTHVQLMNSSAKIITVVGAVVIFLQKMGWLTFLKNFF